MQYASLLPFLIGQVIFEVDWYRNTLVGCEGELNVVRKGYFIVCEILQQLKEAD